MYGRVKLTGSDLRTRWSAEAGVGAQNLRIDEIPYVTDGVCEVHPAHHPICIVSRGTTGNGKRMTHLVPSARRS